MSFLHRGYFKTEEQRFLIEPLSEDGDGDHAVFKYGDVNEETPRVCGVTNTTWEETEEGVPPRILKSRSRSSVRLSIHLLEHYKSSKAKLKLNHNDKPHSDGSCDKVLFIVLQS